MAIQSVPSKKLTLSEIYQFLQVKIQRDPVSFISFFFQFSAKVSILPRVLPGLEELRPSQLVPQRVLHQAAQGPGSAWQGPLLDHRPGPGVHVRGGILQETAPGLQEEGHEAVPGECGVPQPSVQHGGAGRRNWRTSRTSSQTCLSLRACLTCSHELTVRSVQTLS